MTTWYMQCVQHLNFREDVIGPDGKKTSEWDVDHILTTAAATADVWDSGVFRVMFLLSKMLKMKCKQKVIS